MATIWEQLGADAFCGQYGYTGHRERRGPMRKMTYGAKEGQPRCCGKTYEHGSNFTWTHQCDKAAKTVLANGWAFCGIHEPAAVAKRAAASWARVQAQQSKQARAADMRRLELARTAAYPQLVDALRLIAAGHNDPRTLAQQLLATLPQKDQQ